LLLENHYSHAFEEQADDFAAQTLEKAGINPCHLGAILRKMEASLPNHGEDAPDFLSTHPATEKRIRRLDKGKGACL
jgi:predicted Zn-dependent protease